MPGSVIVESPSKTKTIRCILGNGYSTVARVCHVRDLPPGGAIGVEAPDFKANYLARARGAEVIKKLKAEVATSVSVLLPADPDRGGKAIAWQLAEAPKLKGLKQC
jgi:DNA topoisomerase I